MLHKPNHWTLRRNKVKDPKLRKKMVRSRVRAIMRRRKNRRNNKRRSKWKLKRRNKMKKSKRRWACLMSRILLLPQRSNLLHPKLKNQLGQHPLLEALSWLINPMKKGKVKKKKARNRPVKQNKRKNKRKNHILTQNGFSR